MKIRGIVLASIASLALAACTNFGLTPNVANTNPPLLGGAGPLS